MREFEDEHGEAWIAKALKEETPRHHGTWYLVFQPVGEPDRTLPVPEIRWQTAATAARTLGTMSEFELRRRLNSAIIRQVTSANAG